jgi:hypothetical protein
MGKRNNNYDDIIATAVVAAAGLGAGTAFAPGRHRPLRRDLDHDDGGHR